MKIEIDKPRIEIAMPCKISRENFITLLSKSYISEIDEKIDELKRKKENIRDIIIENFENATIEEIRAMFEKVFAEQDKKKVELGKRHEMLQSISNILKQYK